MNESGTELQKHAMDTWQVVKNRLGLISLSVILIFAAAAILTYIMPRKYRGHVEMTIERITQDINVFDLRFEETQAAIVAGLWPC